MSHKIPEVFVIIPAFNEEGAIAKVIHSIPKTHLKTIIVVDNDSKDNTAKEAKKAGAHVLYEGQPGYGAACLKGIQHVNETYKKTDSQHIPIIVFLDGDFADDASYLPKLIAPIIANGQDMVIGSRALGKRERGSMTGPQLFGNWLATRLLKLLYNANFTDLGPFRAITLASLNKIQMKDTTFGWTVEMQLKAAKKGLKYTEIAVPYKQRIGESKISGTIKGTILAGYKILWTIFKYK